MMNGSSGGSGPPTRAWGTIVYGPAGVLPKPRAAGSIPAGATTTGWAAAGKASGAAPVQPRRAAFVCEAPDGSGREPS